MLEIVPMTLREANAFVEQNHRHHGTTVGHKFSIGLSDGEKIVGVAIVGRPVSRHLDDGWTLEVNRLCTDGTRNACSMLYAAAWRAARAMGYKRVAGDMWDGIAYKTLGDEAYTDRLMKLNPQYRRTFVFPAGITLTVPEPETRVSSDLPPWKRGTAE